MAIPIRHQRESRVRNETDPGVGSPAGLRLVDGPLARAVDTGDRWATTRAQPTPHADPQAGDVMSLHPEQRTDEYAPASDWMLDHLLAQAYLFDDPGAYEAGVRDAIGLVRAAAEHPARGRARR